MKLNYDAATDSLYIHLADRPSVDSDEVADGVVLDYDAAGALVGRRAAGLGRARGACFIGGDQDTRWPRPASRGGAETPSALVAAVITGRCRSSRAAGTAVRREHCRRS